jgi:predicted nucleic acid-binding protein
MPAVLVDSNVLIDLFVRDSDWYGWSSQALATAAETSRIVINPIVYAEISVRFTRIEELDALLTQTTIAREPLPYEAAFLAGKAYFAYRNLRGAKHSPLPDFFIGAHAAVKEYQLLTRDTARYRNYFPTVTLIAPES